MLRPFLAAGVALILITGSGAAFAQFPYSQQQILETATAYANYLDEYRHIPTEFDLGGDQYNSAGLTALFAGLILHLDDSTLIKWDTIYAVDPPAELYPAIPPIDSLFEVAPYLQEYVGLCSDIYHTAETSGILPESFVFKGATLRYCEASHLLAGILRFYHFYAYLPPMHEIMVTCPSGLTPWITPPGYEEYTSMVTGWIPYNFIRYNYYTAGKYTMYRRATDIVGTETDYYTAGNAIYDYVKNYWYQAGYYIYIRTFGSRMSADEHLRHNLQNSAFHFQDMKGLYRSLGMPAIEQVLYYPDQGEWIATHVHYPFGSDPATNGTEPHDPPWDDIPLPSPDDTFVTRIRDVMTYAAPHEGGFKSIWINPEDVNKYGAGQIALAAHNGGFNTVILTVKSELGNLYYPTTEFSDRLVFDAITSLISEASALDIDVYAAFSVLADRRTLSEHLDWRDMSETNPDPSYYYPNVSVCPCVDAYRDINLRMISEVAAIPGIQGIVLAHLYWDTISYAFKMGGNPACVPYQGGTGWQASVLESYLQDLVDSIRVVRPSAEIALAFYPLAVSIVNDFYGHQDILGMAALVDRVIFVYDGNFWLVGVDDWGDPNPILPTPYDIGDYAAYYAARIDAPIVISQNLTDEWAFPAKFYNGLFGLVRSRGADGLNLHSPVSMLGEFGEAFTSTQYQKISRIGYYLEPPHICGDAGGDQVVNIGDAVYLINYIFKGGPAPDPLCVGDAGGDGAVNIGDAVYLINYIFKGGPGPVEDCCL